PMSLPTGLQNLLYRVPVYSEWQKPCISSIPERRSLCPTLSYALPLLCNTRFNKRQRLLPTPQPGVEVIIITIPYIPVLGI
ncbi:MAG: hypothetical protein M3Z59_01310, partial [Bombella apis]|nr:hypothetical protein [Bombella apis]